MTAFLSTVLPRNALQGNALRTFMVVFVVAVFASACGANGASGPVLSDADLIIQNATGENVPATSLNDLQTEVPFVIVYPQDLPEGVRLTRAQVSLPPEFMAQTARNRNVRVSLTYANEDATFEFQLQESLGSTTFVRPDIQTLSVQPPNGPSVEIKVFEDAESQLIGAIWSGCATEFVLSASTEGDFNSDWPSRIALATLRACE